MSRFLQQTLEDARFSRAEKKTLKQAVTDLGGNAQKMGLLRSMAFDMARAELGAADATRVMSWLEEVVKVLQPTVSVDDVNSEAFFSPRDDCVGKIRALVRRARRQIDVCVFTITDNRISEVLSEAHDRGVQLRILTDDDKSADLGSDIDALQARGIPVKMDASPNHMHHKFAIFDGRTLLTGSYNWTRSAASANQENFLVTNDHHLIHVFGRQFEQLWNHFA
jgi:phosphatidylserine/phosphatidylglycerophosphate/cardiolipin synthase-like enzyme